ncbi:SoxR reducing system RseC family protein [Shewanella nanhaiensis]|uniref:SoxR reducing system RseC family protein n=1 Tax=Shewanella nanhaiensis TaxID=2864872 RepID=A0ABS7E214_9GAMM|nr:SoxR reducing system RseC family protein [Shewanella nanhaiensis]MBW8183649.1 SoxR reducing system RseC family protein [Shewanella nanhaiensis]
MMEEMAKVLESDGKGWVTVEVQVKNACNHCDNSESCGTSAVSKAFSPKVQRFSIPSDRQYQAGELLKLGLPESVLLKAAALVYLLPLLGLFFGVAVASFITSTFNLASGDFVVIPFAIAGALLFWAKGKKMAKRMESDTQPVIISHLGHSI